MYNHKRRGISLVLAFILFTSVISLTMPAARSSAMPTTASEAVTLQNAGFESGELAPWGPATDVVVQSEHVHSGDYAVSLQGTTAWACFVAQYQIPVEPSAEYELSVWVYAPGSDADIRAYIKDPEIGNDSQQTASASNTDDWQKLTIPFTASATTTKVEIGLNQTNTGIVYADDFELNKIGEEPGNPEPTGFIHTDGSKFVDGNGNEVVFRGIGMWGGTASDTAPYNRFTEADFAKYADIGFNHSRLYMAAPQFQTSFTAPYEFDEAKIRSYLDPRIAWAKKYGMTLMLNLHFTPGNSNTQISDQSLFTDVAKQEGLIRFWETIAGLYKDEPVIAGYDIVNEPKIASPGTGSAPFTAQVAQWSALAQNVVDAIRAIDKNHVIVVERLWIGNDTQPRNDYMEWRWATDGKYYLPTINDNNYAYTYHVYEPANYNHQTATNNFLPDGTVTGVNSGDGTWDDDYATMLEAWRNWPHPTWGNNVYPSASFAKTGYGSETNYNAIPMPNPNKIPDDATDYVTVTNRFTSTDTGSTGYNIGRVHLSLNSVPAGAVVWFKDLVVKEYDENNQLVATITDVNFSSESHMNVVFNSGTLAQRGFVYDPTEQALKFTRPSSGDPSMNGDNAKFALTKDHTYEISIKMKSQTAIGGTVTPSITVTYNGTAWAMNKGFLEYAYTVPLNYIRNIKNVPAYIGETGANSGDFLDNAFGINRGGEQWTLDHYEILSRLHLSSSWHAYFEYEIQPEIVPELEQAWRKAFGTLAEAEENYEVTFKSEGSADIVKTVAKGKSLGKDHMPANPVRDGYAFAGWFSGTAGSGTAFNRNTVPTGDMTVNAYWVKISDIMGPTLPDPGFESGTLSASWGKNGAPTVQQAVVHSGSYALKMVSPPDDYAALFGTSVLANATYEWRVWVNSTGSGAIYVKNYDPRTDFNNTNGSWKQFVKRFTTTAAGSLELGLNLWAGATAYFDDIELARLYNVTFINLGDTVTKTVDAGEALGTQWPANPAERTGFEFDGWFTGQNGTGVEFTSDMIPTVDTTLYAYWRQLPGDYYDVTFYNNGAEVKVVTVPANGTVGTQWPADPEKYGYEFDGWYTEENGAGTKFTADSPVNAYIPLYANWRKVSGTNSITVSSVNQQQVKGLGGGMPWPIPDTGFPVTGNADGMNTIKDLGITVARIYYHNQYNLFGLDGKPTDLVYEKMTGKQRIQGILDEIKWLNDNDIPYNISPGINNLPASCYSGGTLLEQYEPLQIDSIMYVLRQIRDKGYELPLLVTVANEPNAPVNGGGINFAGMPVAQSVRLNKALRTAMDDEGFQNVQLGYNDAGELNYLDVYLSNLTDGSPTPFNGQTDHWARLGTDKELDDAIDAFVTHSYYANTQRINNYLAGYEAQGKGRDTWQTEHALWYEDMPGDRYFNDATISSFISDMAAVKFNYWESWVMWKTGMTVNNIVGNDSLSSTGNQKSGAYYVFSKVFNELKDGIKAGEAYVRTVSTNVPGMNVATNKFMDAVSFVTHDKTVVLLVNPSNNPNAATATATVNGLYGSNAEVWQSNSANAIDDMKLVDTAQIINGKIDYVAMPKGTITVIVTDGGVDTTVGTTYDTAVSSENQQIVKGIGGGVAWGVNPFTDNPAGAQAVLDMGTSVMRIYWHNQPGLFDKNGDPTAAGNTFIEGIVKNVRWLNEHNIPYMMDGSINSMAPECYSSQYSGTADGTTGLLKEDCEDAFIKSNMHVLNAIHNAGLQMPLTFTPWNEPTAPIAVGSGNNRVSLGAIPRDQAIRLVLKMRNAMDEAGYQDVRFAFNQDGEALYASWYAGDDIDGLEYYNSPGPLFDNAGNGTGWPFFNPESPVYNEALDKAVGAFAVHSYWNGKERIQHYLNGYNAQARGRDKWMTEWSPWEDPNAVSWITGTKGQNYTLTSTRQFIMDMNYYQFNYWLYWNLWNTNTQRFAGDAMMSNDTNGVPRKPGFYYVLKKINENIIPGATAVRRLVSNVPGMVADPKDIPDGKMGENWDDDWANKNTFDKGSFMDAVAFVTKEKTVTLLVNNDANNDYTTSLGGLYGDSAEIYQMHDVNMNGNADQIYNKDLDKIATTSVVNGSIGSITLPAETITIIVTNGGADIGEGPTIASLQQSLQQYIASGDITKPLTNQLTNQLDQALHHQSKGQLKQAVQFVENFIMHLNKKGNDRYITESAQDVLNAQAEWLLNLLQ